MIGLDSKTFKDIQRIQRVVFFSAVEKLSSARSPNDEELHPAASTQVISKRVATVGLILGKSWNLLRLDFCLQAFTCYFAFKQLFHLDQLHCYDR